MHRISKAIITAITLSAVMASFAQDTTSTSSKPNTDTQSMTKTQTDIAQNKSKPQTTVDTSKAPEKRLWNLQDANIRAVIDAISNETGKNFLVDPRVQGKISIVSSTPMTSSEAYQVFISALGVLGYSAIPNGNVTKIVPSTNARSMNTPIASPSKPGVGAEPVVRVINVKNVPAAQLVPILRPLLPEWGSITAYTPSNSLVLAGGADNVTRLTKIVRKMDSRASSQTQVIKLKQANADKILSVLTTLQNAERAAGKVSSVSFAADKQTNSVIVNGNPAERAHYVHLIDELDRTSGENANTQVIFLNYLKSKEFAPILAKIAGAEVTATEKGKGDSSAAAAPTLSGGSSGSVTIEAEPSSNAIIINAPPGIMTNLKRVVKRLDVRPKQVLVEAVIASVDENVLNNLGIQWGTVDSTSSSSTDSGTTTTSAFQQGIGVVKSGSIQAVINFLRTNTASDILSTPSIVVLDNQEASLEIGKTISIETGSYANAGASTDQGQVNPFNTFDRQNVALVLKVTPQVSPDQTVRLTIDQKNDTLANPSDPGAQPVVNTAEIKTQVMVNSGNILVLGGLISHDNESTVQSVPILGDIPLLGKLFQYHTKSIDKRNLMVFLRPVILDRNKQSVTANAKDVSHERYNFIRGKQLQSARGENLVKSLKDSPLLPPFEKPKVDIPSPFGEAHARQQYRSTK